MLQHPAAQYEADAWAMHESMRVPDDVIDVVALGDELGVEAAEVGDHRINQLDKEPLLRGQHLWRQH